MNRFTKIIILTGLILSVLIGCSESANDVKEMLDGTSTQSERDTNENRFIVTEKSNIDDYTQIVPIIIKDEISGCEYLYINGMKKGAITPLYDKDGNISCNN